MDAGEEQMTKQGGGSSLLLDSGFVLDLDDGLPLLGNTSSTTLPGSLVFDTASLHLVGEDLGTGLLSLGLVDVLHKDTLVLEDVTLRLLVEQVVQVLVDLSSLSVLPQQPPEHPLSPHPLNFGWHPGVGGTLPLTGTGVSSLTLGGKEIAGPGSRVDDGWLNDNMTVLDELLDMGTRVGVCDLALLSRVEPDFALACTGDGGSNTFLRAKVDHRESCS